MAFDPLTSAFKKEGKEILADQGGVPAVAFSAFLQSALRLPENPQEIAASARRPGAFYVPAHEIALAEPIIFDEIVWRYKVGPYFGETLEAAKRAVKTLQDVADSGYVGQLLARQVVHDEAVEGLRMFAEDGLFLKFEKKNGGVTAGCWRYDGSIEPSHGGAANRCTIKLAVGEIISDELLFQACAHESGHHCGFSISKSPYAEPGINIVKDYKSNSRIYRQMLRFQEMIFEGPFEEMLKPLEDYYFSDIQDLYAVTRPPANKGIGYLPTAEEINRNRPKFAEMLCRIRLRRMLDQSFASEIFAHLCHTETAYPGFFKFYAEDLARSAYGHFSSLEQNLGLPPSNELKRTFLTTIEEIATVWKDSPLAQMLARTGRAIKKVANNPYFTGGVNAGSLGLDIYCSYDPTKDQPMLNAVKDGTAIFTIGYFLGAVELALIGSATTVIGLNIASSICANDPTLNRPWEEVRKEAMSHQEELRKKGVAYPIAAEYMTGECSARALRWINPGYIWNKIKEAGVQNKPDQDLIDAYIAGHANDPWRDSLTSVLLAIYEMEQRKKKPKNAPVLDERLVHEDVERREQFEANNGAAPIDPLAEREDRQPVPEPEPPSPPVKRPALPPAGEGMMETHPSVETECVSEEQSFSKRQPKPPVADWENASVRRGVTENGNAFVGVSVPIHAADYTFNGDVDIYFDSGGVKNLVYALFGKELNGSTTKLRTNFGKYTIHCYEMGHSVLSRKENKDYKVTIKDPDGKTHTCWARNGYKLPKIINAYLNHMIVEKVSGEMKKMGEELAAALESPQSHPEIRKHYDQFYEKYGSYLPRELDQRFLMAIGQVLGVQQAERYQQATPSEVIQGLRNIKPTQNVSSAALVTEQNALTAILTQKLLAAKSEEQLLEAMEKLKGIPKAQSVDVPFDQIPDASPITDKKAFKRTGDGAGRQQGMDRFAKSFSIIVSAYHALKNAAREGGDVGAARKKLNDVLNEETTRTNHVKFKDKTGILNYLNTRHPEIKEAVDGKSPWLVEYEKKSAAPGPDLFGEIEERTLSIIINFNLLLDAQKALAAGGGQEAFDQEHRAASTLLARKVTPDDLQNKEADLSFLTDIDAHYRWCEKHKSISDAANALGTLCKKHIRQENGKEVIDFHAFTNGELTTLLAQAKEITLRASKEGEAYKYGIDIAAAHYNVIGDSYGKFGAHFAIGAMRTIGVETNNPLTLKTAQGLDLFDKVMPGVLQEGILLPLAYYQGFGEAVQLNLRKAMAQRLTDDTVQLGWNLLQVPLEACRSDYREPLNRAMENGRNLRKWAVEKPLDATHTVITVLNMVAPYILKPTDEANHRVYQYWGGLTSALEWARSFKQAVAIRDTALTALMAPFHFYEFLVSPDPSFKNPAHATYLDLAKQKTHLLACRLLLPSLLQPGQMPENIFYFGLRGMVQNLQTAIKILLISRGMTQGSSRAVFAATGAVAAKTLFDGLMGTYNREKLEAACQNAEVYLKQNNYIEALCAFEKLLKEVPYDSKAFNQGSYAGMRTFILSGYYDSLEQIARENHKSKNNDDPLLNRLCNTVMSNRLGCAVSELNAISASSNLTQRVRDNAKKTADHLEELESQFYQLFIMLQVDRIIAPYPDVTSAWLHGIPCVRGSVASEQELEHLREELDSLVAGDGWVIETNPQETAAPKPIPGQPVGIYRQGNNCWLISVLQFLCNVPAYQKQMEALNPHSFYDPLKEAYHQYQMDRKKQGPSSLDNRSLRERLHAAHPKPPFSADSNSEEDPWDILSKFCSDLDMPVDLLDVHNVRDLQAHYSVWCPDETTQEFTVNMGRADVEARLNHKIKNPLHLETQVGNFDSDGFIVHRGVTVDSGHYVAYVKREGYWWEINDNAVRRLSNQEASTFAENGTIFHFQK